MSLEGKRNKPCHTIRYDRNDFARNLLSVVVNPMERNMSSIYRYGLFLVVGYLSSCVVVNLIEESSDLGHSHIEVSARADSVARLDGLESLAVIVFKRVTTIEAQLILISTAYVGSSTCYAQFKRVSILSVLTPISHDVPVLYLGRSIGKQNHLLVPQIRLLSRIVRRSRTIASIYRRCLSLRSRKEILGDACNALTVRTI